MAGHFEFWKLTADGDEYDYPMKCLTAVSVWLQCHAKAERLDVVHLCEIAFKTPDYPVDLTAWRTYDVTIGGETFEQKSLIWNARIYWRTGK